MTEQKAVTVKEPTGFGAFCRRKDIEISVKRYVQEALSAMALGLFASLLIGLILKTLGEQLANLWGENMVFTFLVEIGGIAMGLMGPCIGAAVAWALKAPPLVLFSSIITGAMGATMTGFGIQVAGGPAGAFVAVCLGCELGKMVSKETKVDIIVTPAVTIVTGALAAKLVGPFVGWLLIKLGASINAACDWKPLLFGIFISVVVGLVLTAPISSAALCLMLDLSGLAAGAATAGCCAQMIGFAVMSYRENGAGGVVAVGIGTSMLQFSNILRNPFIVIPPTLAAAITGPISTCLFAMTNNAMGAGMGTSGLVGQIGTFTEMGFTLPTLIAVVTVHFVLPALLTWLIYRGLMAARLIKEGDLKMDI